MRVLIACEFSGIVRDAFIRRGHDAWSCDLLPTESCRSGNHIIAEHNLHLIDIAAGGQFYGYDIRTGRAGIRSIKWELMIAHPPCTRLANSGVRWLHSPPRGKTVKQMWAELEHAALFYKALRDAPIPRKAIENPTMHKYAKVLIAPGRRQIIQPWQFGDPYFKATGLELINLPDLVPTKVLEVPKKGTKEHKEWSAVHRAPPGPDRWKDRSRTFHGIADAFADQWGAL